MKQRERKDWVKNERK